MYKLEIDDKWPHGVAIFDDDEFLLGGRLPTDSTADRTADDALARPENIERWGKLRRLVDAANKGRAR